MKRENPKYIIEEEQILTTEDILEIKINERYLDQVCETPYSQIRFLARFGLIYNARVCPSCSDDNVVYTSLQTRRNHPEGFHWSCKKPCRYSNSIRQGSFFEKSRLSIEIILKMIYKYVNGHPYVDVAYELGIHRNTAGQWAQLVREIIAEHLSESSCMLGGYNDDGTAKVVEIDESLFFKRKYNRGRLTNGTWYIGGIERGSRKTFIVPVENRNAETISQVIIQNVFPGTKIVTDQWKAYKKALDELNIYQHATINHSLNFVDPDDSEIHTQNIEGLWSRSKFYMRKRSGMKQEEHSEMLIQFVWEYSIEKRKRFNTLINLLKFYF